MKKLDSHALQKLRTQLEELPPRQTLRPYDVIAHLAETITGAKARGYEIDDLISVLNTAGITLARNTVRNYLSRALAARRVRLQPSAAQSTTSAIASSAPSDAQRSTQPEQRLAQHRQEPDVVPPRQLAPASTLRERALAAAQTRAAETQVRDDAASSTSAPGRFTLLPDSKDI
jgi:hypothetical protein